MQLDHLKKELSPDEQEILQTFKKSKSTSNNVMMVLACAGVLVLCLFAIRFSGIINQQPDVTQLLQQVIDKQSKIEQQNEIILNNEDQLNNKEAELEEEMDKYSALKNIDQTKFKNLLDTFEDDAQMVENTVNTTPIIESVEQLDGDLQNDVKDAEIDAADDVDDMAMVGQQQINKQQQLVSQAPQQTYGMNEVSAGGESSTIGKQDPDAVPTLEVKQDSMMSSSMDVQTPLIEEAVPQVTANMVDSSTLVKEEAPQIQEDPMAPHHELMTPNQPEQAITTMSESKPQTLIAQSPEQVPVPAAVQTPAPQVQAPPQVQTPAPEAQTTTPEVQAPAAEVQTPPTQAQPQVEANTPTPVPTLESAAPEVAAPVQETETNTQPQVVTDSMNPSPAPQAENTLQPTEVDTHTLLTKNYNIPPNQQSSVAPEVEVAPEVDPEAELAPEVDAAPQAEVAPAVPVDTTPVKSQILDVSDPLHAAQVEAAAGITTEATTEAAKPPTVTIAPVSTVGTRTMINYPDLKPFQVVKPSVDQKSYRYIELDNELKVLMIHDKKEQRAQAALNVLAGSWDEPTDFPGLAHFLEHMLFQGSEKFPKDGHFEKLIASGGGKTNAYTQATKTNYYFSISSEKFTEALEVFSHFFIDPLLKEEMVEKEVNAVNSEYEIDVSGDGWKLLHLLSLISNDNHPMSRFTIGNNESLLKENIVQHLKEFHQARYSSNLMSLVVKSSMSLDKMEEWLRQSDFSKVENKHLERPDYKHYGFPISAEHLGSIVKYHINGHAKTLLFAYQLEDVEQYYEAKPMEFIDAVVKSKHQDGLYSFLIEKGLAVDVDAGIFQEGNGAFNFYLIQVLLPESQELTQESTLHIAQAITAYFNQMMVQFFVPLENSDDVQPTGLLADMWAEKQALADIGFRFLEDSPTSPHSNIFHLSHNLNTYRAEEVLSADYLFKEYDGLLIYDYLIDLLNPNNMVIMIGDESYHYKDVQQSAGSNNAGAAAGTQTTSAANQEVETAEANQEVDFEQDDSENVDTNSADSPISITSFLDTGSQYRTSSFIQLGTAETSPEDVEFINDRSLTKRNNLYIVDWDMKRLNQESLDFITEVITHDFEFKGPLDPRDANDLAKLASLKLPQVNTYVPENLKMVSLCADPPKKEKNQKDNLRKNNKKAAVLLEVADPYHYLPKTPIQDLEVDPLYAKRLDSFAQVDNEKYFGSRDECLKHEREWEKENEFPHLIKKDLEGRAWWKLQRSYEIPAVFAGVKFETALSLKSLRHEALLKLFNKYVQDTLREDLQQSFDAGFKLGFDSNIRGVSLEMFGWSDKFPQFYGDVLTALKGSNNSDPAYVAAQEQRVQRAKSSLLLSYQNTYEKRLYQQALATFLPKVMIQNFYSPEEYAGELQTIDYKEVQQFREKMLSNFRFTTFFAGNVLRNEVNDLIGTIQNIFHETTSHIQVENHLTRVANIHGHAVTMPIISKSANEQDPNGVTLNYYQIGHRDQRQFTIMNLLQGTLQQKAYNFLRTQLQLGYVVAAQFRPLGCLDGAAILVQGTAEPPYVVNKHIESFLKDFGQYLQDMDETEFENLKEGALSVLKENIKSLQEEGAYMWDHIKSNDLAFEEKQVAANIMKQITQSEVVTFYKKVFNNEHHTGKLSLQIYGQGMVSQMGLKNKLDFGEFIEEKLLKETYAGQSETIAFNEDHFQQKIKLNYNCQYKITNI